MAFFKTKNRFAITTVISTALLLSACAGHMPSDLGLMAQDGLSEADTNSFNLRACPESPNCIQTYDSADQDHFKSPLSPKSDIQKTAQALKKAITGSGGEIISEQSLSPEGYYLHAEYTSKWIGFVDDVELLVQAESVHLRSASRLGYADFGINGERFEAIKALYQSEL